ncbi:sodium:solute symporter [Pelagicoccus sp. SDUM812003]|uniref:sodium:solute symporter n=1 Tax=Pelagicoccus sp. SDUM812003 TaxID=3041267 RepID=UPI00280E1FCB|nr:sodium:solute symporter [Pelagicoccus sp. SDUM812003]MDQ8203220.1 sodium:solute symporter [Pelagicoccus sp. SDUM812003]
MFRLFTFLAGVALAVSLTAQTEVQQLKQETEQNELPAAPRSLENAYLAKLGDVVLAVVPVSPSASGQAEVFLLDLAAKSWRQLESLEGVSSKAGVASSNDELYLVGGLLNGSATDQVLQISLDGDQPVKTELQPLPQAVVSPAATLTSGTLYVADGSKDSAPANAVSQYLSLDPDSADAKWQTLDAPLGEPKAEGFLIKSVESIAYLGGSESNGAPTRNTPSYHARYGWSDASPQAIGTGKIVDAAKLGDSHAIALVQNPDNSLQAALYHMIGQTWVTIDPRLSRLPSDSRVIPESNGFLILSSSQSLEVSFSAPETNYGWWDHLSVALYFAVMLWVGFHFAKQSKNSADYFRGGHKIPWWATGMSLFATGASAMSLMAMPGKSYYSNWTFFAISIYSILALPIAMYFFAPIIRKLNFGTAFEYLEERFGLSVRLIGSTIFAVYQILGRMGGVLLLPSFALEAIAGIPMHVSVPIMGLVTIAYTFLGGLSAVIWTDTIQGLVMVSAVSGCLLLVFFRIDMPFSEMWSVVNAQDKLHTFDWGFTLTEENVFTVFLGIILVTLLGIGDQNFVQRVQCGPSLSSTRKAIATQMAVAVPINILLFSLGTALFLFYKQAPAELNPTMRNDGIYPFFAAQQLPPGVSGLVIAALLAATMSTISSSICSVSNLAVDDVYKRFFASATDTQGVFVGRIVTVLVGLFGIGSAFFLNFFETPSIWDLALRVVSIVTSTTVGIYFLGLFTQRSNEIGVLAGIVAGMAVTYWVSVEGILVFWLYPAAGSLVTIAVGYAVSLATGGNKKNIDGLTLASLQNRTGGLDD